LQKHITTTKTKKTTKKECFIGNMNNAGIAITPDEEQMDQDEFEFQIALMLEEEREFNRQRMRETGDYHRIAGVLI
jgi:hypothetical protein